MIIIKGILIKRPKRKTTMDGILLERSLKENTNRFKKTTGKTSNDLQMSKSIQPKFPTIPKWTPLKTNLTTSAKLATSYGSLTTTD
ncbi:hypothetical protein LXL04_020486 [Taraxacum kok-saghyz]